MDSLKIVLLSPLIEHIEALVKNRQVLLFALSINAANGTLYRTRISSNIEPSIYALLLVS